MPRGQRHAVLLENRQDVGLSPADGRLQATLQRLVALLDAHRDVEGERHPRLIGQGHDLQRRVQDRGGVAGQRAPRDGDIHRAGHQVVEQLPGPIAIAARIEEQRVRRQVVEQAAPREALLGRRVDMHADAKLPELGRVQRAEVVAPVVAVGHHVGRAVVGLRPEDEVQSFGNSEDHVARPCVDGVPDKTALVRPPGVDGGGAELVGDDRGYPVLEPLEPVVRVGQVVGVTADAEGRRLRRHRGRRLRMRRKRMRAQQRTDPDRDRGAAAGRRRGRRRRNWRRQRLLT